MGAHHAVPSWANGPPIANPVKRQRRPPRSIAVTGDWDLTLRDDYVVLRATCSKGCTVMAYGANNEEAVDDLVKELTARRARCDARSPRRRSRGSAPAPLRQQPSAARVPSRGSGGSKPGSVVGLPTAAAVAPPQGSRMTGSQRIHSRCSRTSALGRTPSPHRRRVGRLEPLPDSRHTATRALPSGTTRDRAKR